MKSLKTYLRRLMRDFSCGGTRVRSISLTKWAGRAYHARATLKTQSSEGIRTMDALGKRGCVIPWRRPSWVRIPPPAPGTLPTAGHGPGTCILAEEGRIPGKHHSLHGQTSS